MAHTASSSDEELLTDRAGAYDYNGADTDDDDEDDNFEDDGFEDDGLEAAPFDEEAEMQKLIAEAANSGNDNTEASNSALAQLDSSIDILDRGCHDNESSHSRSQKANEHVDSFVRSWCSLLAPTSSSSSLGNRRGAQPPPRFELFVARLQGLRAGSASGKVRWLYSDAEVASASELAQERSNSSSSGYVGVGELQHFMCLCKFLATTPSVENDSESDSSDDDDDCDWAALTPTAFRQRFAASLATAAADAAGSDSGAEIPVYVPPMSRERFLELYDHFDVGVDKAEEVVESSERLLHDGSMPSPPSHPSAERETASLSSHLNTKKKEDASSGDDDDEEEDDDDGNLASSGGDVLSASAQQGQHSTILRDDPPSPERHSEQAISSGLEGNTSAAAVTASGAVGEQEVFGRGSPGRTSNGGRRYLMPAPLADPAVHQDNNSSSSGSSEDEDGSNGNSGAKGRNTVENKAAAAAAATERNVGESGHYESLGSALKETVPVSSNVGISSHHHHWLGEPSNDFEEVYSNVSMAAASYSGLRQEPPLDSLSESSSSFRAPVSHSNSSSNNSSTGFMAPSWQRAPLAANLAVLGDRGTALSLEVRGLKLPHQEATTEGSSRGGGVVFDATIMASALQLALLANADCAEVLQEMAGSPITVSDGNDSVDVMSSHSSVTKGSSSSNMNEERARVERSNVPVATDSNASVQSSSGGQASPLAPLLRWGAGSQVELAQCAEPGSRRLVRLRCSQLPPTPNLKWLLDLLNYAPPPQPSSSSSSPQPTMPQATPLHASNEALGLLPPPLPSSTAVSPSNPLRAAPSLPVGSTLRHLELVGCGILDSMLASGHEPLHGEVSSIFEYMESLESLDLTANGLTHPPLELPPKLRSLKLASNRLNTLVFLEKRGSLRTLDASHNAGLTGFAQLFALTPLKDTLSALQLSGCPLVETTPGYRRSVANLIAALEILDGNAIHRTGSYTAARSAAVAHQATAAAGAARAPSRPLGQHLAPSSSSSANAGSKAMPPAHAAAMAAAAAATAQATRQSALSQHVSSYGYAANAGGMGAIKVLQTAGFGRQKPSDHATAASTVMPTTTAAAAGSAAKATAHHNHHAVVKPHPKDLAFSLDGSRFARPASAAAAAALAAAQARELPPLPEELAGDEGIPNDLPDENALGYGEIRGVTAGAAGDTDAPAPDEVAKVAAPPTTTMGAAATSPEHLPTSEDTSESDSDYVSLGMLTSTKKQTSTAEDSSTTQGGSRAAVVRASRSSAANSSDEDSTRAMSRARSIGLAHALGGRLSPDPPGYVRSRTPSWAYGDPGWAAAAAATSPPPPPIIPVPVGSGGKGRAGRAGAAAMDHAEAEAEAKLMAAEAQLLEELQRLDQQHTSSRSRSRPSGGTEGRHHHHHQAGSKHAIAQAHANGWMPASHRRRSPGGLVPLPLEVTFAAQHAPPNSSTTADDDNTSFFVNDDDNDDEHADENDHHHYHNRPGERSMQSNATNYDVSMRDTSVSDFTAGSTIGDLGGHHHHNSAAQWPHPNTQRASRSPLRGIIGGGSDTDGGLGDTIRDSFSRSRSRQNPAHAINAGSAAVHPPFRPSGPGGSAFSGPSGASHSTGRGGSVSRASASPPSSLARPSTSLTRRASPSRASGTVDIVGGGSTSEVMHGNEGTSRQGKGSSKQSEDKKKKAKAGTSMEFANHEVSAADAILRDDANKAPTSSVERTKEDDKVEGEGVSRRSSSVAAFLAGCRVTSEALAEELAELGASRASDLIDLTQDEATAAGVAAGLKPLEVRRFDAALAALRKRHQSKRTKNKKKLIGRGRAAGGTGDDDDDDDDDDEDEENVGSVSNRARSTRAPRRLSRKSRVSRRSARREKRLSSNNGALSDSASSAAGGGVSTRSKKVDNTFGLGHGERHGDSSDGTTPKGWPSMVFTKCKKGATARGLVAASTDNCGVLSPLSGGTHGQNSVNTSVANGVNEPASASTTNSQDSSVFERLHALWKLREEHRAARAQELFEIETKALTFSPDRARTADYHSKPAAQKREQQRKAVALREKALKRQATARRMAQKQRQARRSGSGGGGGTSRLSPKRKQAVDAHVVANNCQRVGFGSSSRGHDGGSCGGHFASNNHGGGSSGSGGVKFTAVVLPTKVGFLSATKASQGKDAAAASDSDPLWREVDRQGTPLAKKAWGGSAIAQGTTLRSSSSFSSAAVVVGGKTSVSPQRRQSSTAKANMNNSSNHGDDALGGATERAMLGGNSHHHAPAPHATAAGGAAIGAGAESPWLSETPERRNLADKLAAAGNSAGRSGSKYSSGGFDSSNSTSKAWAGAGRQALEGALADVKREVEAHAKALSSHTKGVSRLQKVALSAAAAKLGIQVGSLTSASDSDDAAGGADGGTFTSSSEAAAAGVDLVAWKAQAQVLDGQLRSARARLASLLTALHESSAAATAGGNGLNLQPTSPTSGAALTPTSSSSSSLMASQDSSNGHPSSRPFRSEGFTTALPTTTTSISSSLPPFLSPIADGGEESSGPESAGPASRRRSPHPPRNTAASWTPSSSEDASKAALAALLRGLPPRSCSHSVNSGEGDGGSSGSGSAGSNGSSISSVKPERSTPTPGAMSAAVVSGAVVTTSSNVHPQTPAALENAAPFTAETFRALTSPPVSNGSGRSERAVTLEELATSDLVIDDEPLEDGAEGLRKSTDRELQPNPATSESQHAAAADAAAVDTVLSSTAFVAASSESSSSLFTTTAAAVVTESNKKVSTDSDRMLTMLAALRAQEATQAVTNNDDSNADTDNSTSAVTESAVVAPAADSTLLTGASGINTTEEVDASLSVHDSHSDLSAALEGFEEAAMASLPPTRVPPPVPPPAPRAPSAPSSSSSSAAAASSSSAAAQRVVAEVPGAQASVLELNSVLERLHEIEATKARRARRARQLKRMGGSDASSEALLMRTGAPVLSGGGRAGSGRDSGSETDGAASAVETAEELDAEQKTLEIWLLSLELSPSSEV